MPQHGLFSDILRRIARSDARSSDAKSSLLELCEALLSDKGEASVLTRSQAILDRLAALDTAGRIAFFEEIAAHFGPDEAAVEKAIANWKTGDTAAARALHFAAEPRSQSLIRALNSVPGATAQLVALREDLLAAVKKNPALSDLDRDFAHLFASWFNRGFLEIRRISWETPAAILEKIIAYEAVHEIAGWDDLRQRVADPDRRLFAFFHPAMPSDPLIFVEVALTEEIPGAIAPILSKSRDTILPEMATTAVFYSISNCQKGLRGISFGNFLIKQVVAELSRELPQLNRFVTLSPVPMLRRWALEDETLLTDEQRFALRELDADAAPPADMAREIAARYLLGAKRGNGSAFDPVAHFHLGNGAELFAIHPDADMSDRGFAGSWGLMVNYLYDGDLIEKRHSDYATAGVVAASKEVKTASKLK